MPLLKLELINYKYPQKEAHVLHNANLELNAGEILGLLGSNGSGKSTLLHIASGLIVPHSGTVTLCGRECVNEEEFSKARKNLGYLLQNSEDMLFCPTILEDVAFGPYNNGKTSKEAQDIAWDTLKSLEIEQFADSNGNSLSGGEKKLAALACILAMKPKLLFLDEPTNNLDPQAREKMIHILKEQQICSLIISHDIEFIRNLCTRFCVLEHGHVRDVEKLRT